MLLLGRGRHRCSGYERCRESFHCVWLFVHTSGQRSHARKYNNDRAEEKEYEKTGPNHGKLQLFAEESDRWSVKQGICIVCRPELYSERPIPPYMASFATTLIDDCWCWMETFTAAAALNTAMRLLLQQQARALTHNAAARA
jgi:hypothetical protein